MPPPPEKFVPRTCESSERASVSKRLKREERELKTAIRGTVGSLTRFHWVCEEGGQWQACTNGLILQPGLVFRSFARKLEYRA